jgi:signal transduction histidine kinase
VHNEGTPICADRMASLFRSSSVNQHPPAGRESTGLGLSIVEQCIHQLGAAVWARSSEDEGTTFFFTLPAELA